MCRARGVYLASYSNFQQHTGVFASALQSQLDVPSIAVTAGGQSASRHMVPLQSPSAPRTWQYARCKHSFTCSHDRSHELHSVSAMGICVTNLSCFVAAVTTCGQSASRHMVPLQFPNVAKYVPPVLKRIKLAACQMYALLLRQS